MNSPAAPQGVDQRVFLWAVSQQLLGRQVEKHQIPLSWHPQGFLVTHQADALKADVLGGRDRSCLSRLPLDQAACHGIVLRMTAFEGKSKAKQQAFGFLS